MLHLKLLSKGVTTEVKGWMTDPDRRLALFMGRNDF
jgi:hypothetical protein